MKRAEIFFVPRKTFIVFFSLLLLVFVSCGKSILAKKNIEILSADGKKVVVRAEIADTFESRQKGFMFRKRIPDGTGMLFVFEGEQILNFWMKNTPTALSIAYISADGKIKDIFDMTPFSLSPIVSTAYVRYALEVPKGWFYKNGINVGDRLNMDFLD